MGVLLSCSDRWMFFFFFNIPNVTDVFCTSRVFLQTLQDLNPERHDRKKKKGSLSRAPFFYACLNGQATGVLKNPLHVQEEPRMNK